MQIGVAADTTISFDLKSVDITISATGKVLVLAKSNFVLDIDEKQLPFPSAPNLDVGPYSDPNLDVGPYIVNPSDDEEFIKDTQIPSYQEPKPYITTTYTVKDNEPLIKNVTERKTRSYKSGPSIMYGHKKPE